jgi:nicotinamidase-related amidase
MAVRTRLPNKKDANINEIEDNLIKAPVPNFQTHQALIVIGLQEDFISSTGILPVPLESGFVERIKSIVPRFRDGAGEIIWVQTEANRLQGGDENPAYQAAIRNVLLDTTASPHGSTSSLGVLSVDNAEDLESAGSGASTPLSTASPTLKAQKSRTTMKGLLKKVSSRKTLSRQDQTTSSSSVAPKPNENTESASLSCNPPPTVDPELFLSRSSVKTACLPGTPGVEFAPAIKELIQKPSDMIVSAPRYSAFDDTNLVRLIRSKFITEVYLCGCLTNISVYATALDAARHGLKLNIVEDCLGYRIQSRHDEALTRMSESLGAEIYSSAHILDDLARPTDAEAAREKDAKEIEGLLGDMRVKGDSSSTDLSASSSAVRALKALSSIAPSSASRAIPSLETSAQPIQPSMARTSAVPPVVMAVDSNITPTVDGSQILLCFIHQEIMLMTCIGRKRSFWSESGELSRRNVKR